MNPDEKTVSLDSSEGIQEWETGINLNNLVLVSGSAKILVGRHPVMPAEGLSSTYTSWISCAPMCKVQMTNPLPIRA